MCARGPAGAIRGPVATEVAMKLFVLFAIAALIVGGINHTEVSRFIAGLDVGSSRSGGATSVVGSMKDMGNSGKSLMGGIGNSLNR